MRGEPGNIFSPLSGVVCIVAGMGVEPMTSAYETDEIPPSTHPVKYLSLLNPGHQVGLAP